MSHEVCAECGFDGGRLDEGGLLGALRGLGGRWRVLLVDAGALVGDRPAAEVWSAIEYAAHSRDIIALHVYGMRQALTRDEPVFPPIADDLAESAAATYAGLDPAEVADELDAQARLLAQVADEAGISAWSRGLTIGDARSDVRRLLEHALHDSQHHLADVDRGLIQLRGS